MEAMNPKEYLLSTLTKAAGEEDLIASPQNTITVLQKYDFQFKKQFGQNFLVDRLRGRVPGDRPRYRQSDPADG